ncbi:ABC transporter permease [Planobispora takensis]|uniref:Transporter n=1 Tax=Planobispora takensis TaxID=1367882 RepID=A0A8J3SUD6_9ACTN|nr:ABC transporter permease [Planobispora takensis]GIH99765.1 transporter [Planobispora takensis]
MLWLTWRQHRAQILVTGGLLLALGLLLLVSGLRAGAYAAEHAPPGCPGPAAACLEVNTALYEDFYNPVYLVFGLLPFLGSGLIGAFWGAPVLAAEFERGTATLAWTQSVSVGRWLAVKLAVLGAVVVTAALALSAMIGLWLTVFRDALGDRRFHDGVFSMVGVVPAAWWLFAFMLGAAAGTFFRRTLAAMAVTVAVIALTVPVVFFSRDAYAEPDRTVTAEWSALFNGDGKVVGQAWVDPAGRERPDRPSGVCPPPSGVPAQSERAQTLVEECLIGKGYRMAVYHHPPSRFWRFQWTETGILLTAALVLGGLTAVRTLRRRS